MVLKSVLTKVDFPKPDSPRECGVRDEVMGNETRGMGRTNDHYSKLETLPHTFTVYLVGKIGKTDIAHKFFANDWGDTGSVARK